MQRTLIAFVGRALLLVSIVFSLCLPMRPLAARTLPVSQVTPSAFNCTAVNEIPQSECKALVAIYNSMNGPFWNEIPTWLTTSTPCHWTSVTCQQQHVIKLDFFDCDSLLGDLPKEIGDLSNLQVLSMPNDGLPYTCNNEISSIPVEIGKLVHLQILNLGNGGSNLPTEIGNLTNLQTLILSYNSSLTSLPAEIGSLTNLQTLSIGGKFTDLPTTIGALKNLQTLKVIAKLTTLPTEIGKLINLQTLDLTANQLVTLPSTIGNLNRLKDLELGNFRDGSGNYFDGNRLTSLPAEIARLISLQTLNVGGNQLAEIPPAITQLAALQTLDLSGNSKLTGPTPQAFIQLKALRYLVFYGTSLCLPTNVAFQAWWFNTGAVDYPVPCLQLTTNFVIGAPGSQFTLVGSTFAPTNTLTLSVNHIVLGKVPLNEQGKFTVTLDSTSANNGSYALSLASATDDFVTQLRLAPNAPLHASVGASIFTIPPGVAYTNWAYLPVVPR
ncbi:MAG: hypothetical protein U0350_05655 [Caldilineaceae bacterium]